MEEMTLGDVVNWFWQRAASPACTADEADRIGDEGIIPVAQSSFAMVPCAMTHGGRAGLARYIVGEMPDACWADNTYDLINISRVPVGLGIWRLSCNGTLHLFRREASRDSDWKYEVFRDLPAAVVELLKDLAGARL